jgi:hypothetical protein
VTVSTYHVDVDVDDCHDIHVAEILLKVALNTNSPNPNHQLNTFLRCIFV